MTDSDIMITKIYMAMIDISTPDYMVNTKKEIKKIRKELDD